MLLIVGVVSVVIGFWFGMKKGGGDANPVMTAIAPPGQTIKPGQIPLNVDQELALGEQLSEQVCSACHIRPTPDVLDRITWAMDVLPGMAEWLGMNPGGTNALALEPRVAAAHIMPTSPMMSVEEWRAICSYYLAYAPPGLPLATNRPHIEAGLKNFQVMMSPERVGASSTLIKIDTNTHNIYYGESISNILMVLDQRGKAQFQVGFSSPPVDLEITGDNLYLTLLGSYTPSDELDGKLLKMGDPTKGRTEIQEVITGMPRSPATVLADINHDGRMDFVNCGYGNILGRLAWYESKADGTYVEHPIIERPGAGSVRVYDFNKDGWPDLLVGMAQAREGIYVCLNDHHGNFEINPIAEMHPAWGLATIELADVDGDGQMDILACNGDNGDFTDHLPPMRPYHGLRIYHNEGNGKFKETFFMPINGCYKAMVADFDLDGDPDIAVISFYPDYRHSPQESFIYLENVGPWQYRASSFDASISGRWITMDVGDLDGDGAPDIVLGAHNRGPTFVPDALAKKWSEVGPSVIILHNTIKEQKR